MASVTFAELAQGTSPAMDELCSNVGYHTRMGLVLAVVGAIIAAWFIQEHFWSFFPLPLILGLQPMTQLEAQIEAGCRRYGYWSTESLIVVFLVIAVVGVIVTRFVRNRTEEKRMLERRINRLEEERDQHKSSE